MSQADKKKEAKKLFKQATAKFDDGSYAEALPLYQQADALIPGGVPKFQMAQCHDKMGNAADAVKQYEAFLATSPDAKKHKVRIDKANSRLEELKRTPATVSVAVTPADAPNLSVTIDGKAEAATELKLAPGKHTIVVKADGFEEQTTEFEVSFGEKTQVNIPLKESQDALPAGGPPPVQPEPDPDEPQKEERSMVPAYVTLGLAGVGAVVGTIFGIQALGSKSDFEDDPTQESFDDTERNALIADMSYGVALTFGVTGVVLLLSGGDSAAETGQKASRQRASSNPLRYITPYAGPDGGGAAAKISF